MNTRLANIIFIVLSVGLVLGVLFNFWFSHQFDVISEPLIKTDNSEFVSDEETENWQTYTNYEYGFSIKYPEEWSYQIQDLRNKALLSLVFSNIENKKTNHIDISIYDYEYGMSLKQETNLSETKIFYVANSYVYEFEVIFEKEETMTQELRQVYLEVFKIMVGSFETVESPEKGTCRPTGCSNQICADQEVMTTCEYSEVFACYKNEVCERQDSGECGWTMSETLRKCLKDSAGVVGVTNTAM